MQNSKQKIMILGAGQMQVPVIKKCREMNLYSIAVDIDEHAPGFKYADKNLLVSTHDKEEILRLARNEEIDGILTTSDYPVNSVAFVAKQLGLKALSQDAARLSTNKFLLRERLENYQLNCPNYIISSTLSELDQVCFFPAIIKPIDSSASRGVKKVDSQGELYEQFERSKKFSVEKQVIVEEFLSGKEYSVESVSQGGKHHILSITEKTIVGENEGLFVELAHRIPAPVSAKEEVIICEQILAALNAIGLDNSAAHSEIILSGEKAYIIEIGARLGGDFIGSDLVPLACGVDMLGNIVKVAIGDEIDVNKNKKSYSGIHFITPDNYQSAAAFIKTQNSIVRYEIDEFRETKIENSLDRLGYIIVTADSRMRLDDMLRAINNENK